MESLHYIRECNQRDFPSKGFIYLHHFGTGHQMLTFDTHEEAKEFEKTLNKKNDGKSNNRKHDTIGSI